jgi:hypothetical protein
MKTRPAELVNRHTRPTEVIAEMGRAVESLIINFT